MGMNLRKGQKGRASGMKTITEATRIGWLKESLARFEAQGDDAAVAIIKARIGNLETVIAKKAAEAKAARVAKKSAAVL